LPGAPVKRFREIAQADAAGGNVFNQGSGKKTAIGDLDGGVGELDAGMQALVSPRHALIALSLVETGRLEMGAKGRGCSC